MNLVKRIETFVIIAIIGVIGAVYAVTRQPVPVSVTPQDAQTQQNQQPQQQVQQVASSRVSYQGVEGKTALELLKAGHVVKSEDFAGVGEFVAGIDGLEADGVTNFWSFYVNGQQATVGAGQYVTKNGDVIEWKLESIDPM